ncbi:DMT family transporter [Wenxinia marina]|uniref:Permease of the drug/metabolite transporter (DMT) superfamily n=1 Tax=Wenxinia marina DSM 24838 TaxID=1123501 RepID=A0A0D0Q5L6_9RHOB|nr:DMT family transporter [Wenxinia marina]KIQ67782.1 Permease of the drug/metabolite transporter (DMT) superfamily [Wenxinia marina DSM 24838]GGL77285.1 multidrug transporter [Wenxinia marina]
MRPAAVSAEADDAPAVGIAWLLTDMTLVTVVNVLVKATGTEIPAFQLVFLRAAVGLILIAPLVWGHRDELRRMGDPWRNAGRVACNAAALTLTFTALTMLPLAVVNAVGFTRPLVTMGLAVLLLRERVARSQWGGLAVTLAGVVVIVAPGQGAFGPIPVAGVLVALAGVGFGAMAAVQTRALRGESTMVMMLFYTVGLCGITAIPAAVVWTPPTGAEWLTILVIGAFAQGAQLCFLRAYRAARASVLSPVSHVSILFATLAGWLVFAERPGPTFVAGAGLILAGGLIGAAAAGARPWGHRHR